MLERRKRYHTGFSPILKRPTAVEDVKLIRSIIKSTTGIKAAEGIKTCTDCFSNGRHWGQPGLEQALAKRFY